MKDDHADKPSQDAASSANEEDGRRAAPPIPKLSVGLPSARPAPSPDRKPSFSLPKPNLPRPSLFESSPRPEPTPEEEAQEDDSPATQVLDPAQIESSWALDSEAFGEDGEDEALDTDNLSPDELGEMPWFQQGVEESGDAAEATASPTAQPTPAATPQRANTASAPAPKTRFSLGGASEGASKGGNPFMRKDTGTNPSLPPMPSLSRSRPGAPTASASSPEPALPPIEDAGGLDEATDYDEVIELDGPDGAAPVQQAPMPERTSPEQVALHVAARQGFSSGFHPAPTPTPEPPPSGRFGAEAEADLSDEFDAAEPTTVFSSQVGPAPSPPTSSPSLPQPNFGAEPSQPNFSAEPSQPSFGAQPAAEAPSPQSSQPQPGVGDEAPAPAELDDDFTAQKTEVIHSPFERDILAPRLKAVDGPVAGQEFFVTGLRSTVGRGENNSVMIADLAMSREHFELIKNSDESFLIRDLGSANGTMLNGTPVKEATLFHGDRVEVGKSTLEFYNEAAPPKPHRHFIPVAGVTIEGEELDPFDDHTRMVAHQLDQSTRFFTRVSLFAGLLCIPLCVLLIVASTMSAPEDAESAPAPTQPPTAVSPRANAAADFYLKGVEAARNREWETARAHFEKARAEDDQLDISAQLARVDRELDAKEALEKARAAAEREDPDAVLSLISSIPRESAYFDEAQQLTRDKRRDEINSLYEKALAQLTEDELDGATESVDAILELVPNHSSALTLKERIETRREELERAEQAALANKSDGGKSKGDDNDDGPSITFDDPFSNNARKKKSSSGDSAGLGKGYTLYKREKFDAAASFFDKKGAKGKKLAGHVRAVSSGLRLGESATKRKQWGRAVTQLSKAQRSDAQLGKHHRKKINKLLADAYGNKGLQDLKKKNYTQARKSLTSGTKLGSASSLKQLDRELLRAATSLYIQAANKKKSDPSAARDICRTIMKMVPSSSTPNKKARKLLMEL